MSNSVRRPPLRGVIVRGDRIVGGVDLPDPSERFIEHFNQEYKTAGLRVVPVDEWGKDKVTSSKPQKGS